MSARALAAFPQALEIAERCKDPAYVSGVIATEKAASDAWYAKLNKNDKGQGQPGWADAAYDDSSWPRMRLPCFWRDVGLDFKNGVIWFRREFELPAECAGQAAMLLLGTIVDSDTTYINGQMVGTTAYQYPPRRYPVPAGVLKSGRNVVVTRVVSNIGVGGFIKQKPYKLILADREVGLSGEWAYCVGARMEALQGQTFFEYKPTSLYNGMIHPLLGYTIKGALWYQGETNAGYPENYRELMSSLIADWRARWGQGDFPFIFTQLPNYSNSQTEPERSLAIMQGKEGPYVEPPDGWAELRERQRQTLTVPNTAMAVTIDLGEWNDLHPEKKKDVARRLALAARRLAYGEAGLVSAGPMVREARLEGSDIVLTFSEVGSGLRVQGGSRLGGFTVAGADRRFTPVAARIAGSKVLLSALGIKEPAFVHYAWADNPVMANLRNAEGLPASPFEAPISR
jgi:sialate O-acetylesterase